MGKSYIEWCDEVLNPAWGCRNNCNFCYAKKFAKRFGRRIGEKRDYSEDIIQKMINYEPVFFPDYENIFDKVCKSKKPKRIFVNSMSDICYWKHVWICETIAKIKKFPQHIFLFLTKNPDIYADYKFPDNCWLGITITNQERINRLINFTSGNYIFFSLEPILEPVELLVKPNWLIIGAETGNRKNKVIPEKSWIANLLLHADKYMIPVFMKDNLKPVWGDDLIQEFPK